MDSLGFRTPSLALRSRDGAMLCATMDLGIDHGDYIRTRTMKLEPLSPQEGVTMYLDSRKPEIAQSTLYAHKCRLTRFLEYCEQEGIENMNNVTSRTAYSYRMYRQEDVAPTTLENSIRTFRLFIEFCESIDGVPDGVANKINVPTARRGERSKSIKLAIEQAEEMLNYLGKYEHASFRHTIFVLLWNTGMRTSGIRALDIEDYEPNVPGGPLLVIKNRPEQGTPLKNRRFGEREVNLPDWAGEIIDDYIDKKRHDVTDDYNWKPLITTTNGRPGKTTIQRSVYVITQPCYIGWDCPIDNDPEECEYTSYNQASKCPDSVSPHAIRRGSASYQLDLGMPKHQVCDRINVTSEVLDEHYDDRSTQQRRELRRDWVDKM